ncbi:cytoplasmic 60S subunit biogenesis factor ZNF622-like [Onthophagus taurus]|uniref:cytoplasmic 60S subunit biogenesis factor ZNF622-like n=1 Tax=Onthophagus taurus TaxID=166361 RepID=UPI0039BE9B83
MDTFTCISCRVVFNTGDIQRQHYKSDWHRYNLKRKVAELPPVSAEDFQKKVILQRAQNEDLSADTSTYCQVCRKSFGNGNAYDNHLNSKKHKENEKNYKENPKSDELDDEEMEEVDSDEWEEDIENPIDNNDCLFCSHHSKNLLNVIKHMTQEHGFFIPDIEFCIDIKGLLLYLGEKINSGFICLWCNEKGKTFHTSDAAKKHMIDKGHCKMLHEGETLAEYADFYDYSSSYPDQEENDSNSEVSIPELDDSDFQLVLPSGAVIGHRSLMRYYRQSINPNRAVVVAKNEKKLHKVLASYRALGWSETDQKAAAKKARDLHHMKRLQSKYNMVLGCRGNKLQKHFRAQVNF